MTKLYFNPISHAEMRDLKPQYRDSQSLQCQASGSVVSSQERGRTLFGVYLTGQGRGLEDCVCCTREDGDGM